VATDVALDKMEDHQQHVDMAAWERIREKLRQTYGDAIFKSWLKPLEFAGVESGSVLIHAPTRFMRDWINNNYLETMRRFWQIENGQIHKIDLVVRASAPALKTAQQNTSAAPSRAVQPSRIVQENDEEGSIELNRFSASLDPRYTFDNFVVGKPNELAFGGVGLGKTHLMHAIAWHIRRTNPGRKVMYLSAEKFMYQFVRALRFNETIAFKEQFRSVDVLMVDDVQFISGKDSTQEEFFHTFNSLVEQNKQLVISADRSPSDLEGLEERVRSRLGWGLVADINDTSFELRLGILQSKAEKLTDVVIPYKVLEFLAHKVTSNVRELEGALNRVAAHASLVGREITLEHTQELLKDLLRCCDKRVTIEDIQKKVATHYNIKVSDMHSGRRSVSVARPRQIAMYLSKQLTPKSLPEIGRKFGGKDHTTVMHAVKRIEELKQQDTEMVEDIEILGRQLQS